MFKFFKRKKVNEEISKETYCVVMFLFASSEEQTNYVKSEAIKLLKDKKDVITLDNDLNISMTDETVEKLKEYFGIKFNDEE